MRNSRRRRNQTSTRDQLESEQKQAVVTVEARSEEWRGPLPAPDTLKEFDDVVPGSAERIITEWTKETDHRRAYERRALTYEAFERLGGRVAAFLFALAALGVAGYCAHIDREWAATVIGGTTIASVVAAMIWRK